MQICKIYKNLTEKSALGAEDSRFVNKGPVVAPE